MKIEPVIFVLRLLAGRGLALAVGILAASAFLFTQNAHGWNADIVINEIGAYEKSGAEWIEVVNKSVSPIDMSEWKFWEDQTNHGLTLSHGDDMIISPGEFALIVQNDINFMSDYPGVSAAIFDSSWNALNESGEEIGLKNSAGEFVEQFTYISASDFSLERVDSTLQDYSSGNWIEHPSGNSAGFANYWKASALANKAPAVFFTISASTTFTDVLILFDASASADSDGTIQSYAWDFGDGKTGSGVTASHSYGATGTYFSVLTVIDDKSATSSASAVVNIIGKSPASSASTGQLVSINEFVSDPASGEEWIELYNGGASAIVLNGWTLHDGNGQIAALESLTIAQGGFAVVEMASSKLNNGGDIIYLKNQDGGSVDKVAYGDWNDGSVGDNAPAPAKGSSVARASNGNDTGNDKNDFFETVSPTKGSNNAPASGSAGPPVGNPPPASSGGGVAPPAYSNGDVVVNEIVSDPADGLVEFIELFNASDKIINLLNWRLEDGGEARTELNGAFNQGEFFVVEDPAGSLNNSGDVVFLFDPSGREIDKVAYGAWDDGNVSDNAPTAADPFSLARIADGRDSGNDYYDFALSVTVTKGGANIITQAGGGSSAPLAVPQSIIINEFMPNPGGSDSNGEFIELKNIGVETVDIKGWQISDNSSVLYVIKQGVIQPGGFISFKRSMTGIALNNTGGDEVRLFALNGALVDSAKYAGRALEGGSYARGENSAWAWTKTPTAGAANAIEKVNTPPVIVLDVDASALIGENITFDASDTTDPDGGEIYFEWDFGDGGSGFGDLIEYSFKEPGLYTATLIARDSDKGVSEKKVIVEIEDEHDFTGGSFNGDVSSVLISEFLPDPEGSDTAEFIELHNPTENDIDLSGLKLDDSDGGSRAYAIPNNTIIRAGGYIIFNRNETKLALNNAGDAVRVLLADETLASEVKYDSAVESAAYARDIGGAWAWTANITPGEKNVFGYAQPRRIESLDSAGLPAKKSSSKAKQVFETSLEKIREFGIGDKVKVSGVVAVMPGVLGSQFFYITSAEVPAGVQIYMYKKDFPEFEVGDSIEVAGELSEAHGEARIKISQKSDFKKTGHAGVPSVELVEIAEIGENMEGWLAQVQGEITSVKTNYMYVDDGSEEIKVYFKRGAGIDNRNVSEGDFVSVSGIVSQTKTGYQMLPRSQDDIVKTGVNEIFSSALQNGNRSRGVAETYLTTTAGGLTAIFIGLFGRARAAMLFGLLKRVGNFVLTAVSKKRG